MASASHRRIRVLHVDDESAFTRLTRTFLEREDEAITVETATSADDSLESIADRPPDCVVSDYNMAGMDGIELLRAVREDHPDLPFILFTGKGSEEVASEAISAGATDYLQKQAGTEQYGLLANRIRNAVTQYRSEKRLQRTRTEYSAVFENAQNGLLLVDVDGAAFRYRRCNPRAVELIGRDKDAIVGKTPHEALGAENGPKVVGAYRACIRRREPVEYTVTLDLPVGRVVRQCKATPVVAGETVEQLVVTFHDVTERHTHREALETERGFITQALDALEDLFVVVDAGGGLRRWNDRVAEVTGHADAELAEMSIAEVVPETDRDRVVDAVETAFTAGEATVEADVRTADGQRVPHEVTTSPLTDGDGDTTGVAVVARDMSEHHREERRFRALVEESSDIISVVDAEGRFQYQSPSLERVLGYDPDETVGEAAWTYIHPDDREAVRDSFEEWVVDPETTEPIEYRARHADGSWRWMEARGNNQLDNPVVEGYVVNSRDVTDRRRRKRRIQEIKGQYQTLVEHFPDGAVFLYDADHRVVRAGGADLAAGGVSPAAAEGTTPHERYAPETAERLVDHIEAALAGECRTFDREEDGEQHRVQTVPVRIDGGDITHAMVVSQNITEQVKHRRALERHNEQLDEFASIVSHDLRNPLTVAGGYVELARETGDDVHLARASAAIERSQALIDDLLTLAKEGDAVAAVEPVAIAAVAEECWQNVETGPVPIEVDATRSIRADRSRLQQLFENLYRNAVEHGGEDVTVTVGETADGFYVADTGPGIPESDRTQVFEAGYSTSTDGTGFGLRIVEQVATAHGWAVDIAESEAGGARFEITGVEFVDE